MDYKTIFKRKIPILIVVVLILMFGALSSCFGETQNADDGKTNIVNTMLYDFTDANGSERVETTALMHSGTSAHLQLNLLMKPMYE